MNRPLRRLAPALLLLVLGAGCVSRPTAGGGHETSVLGGFVTVTQKSFAPPAPTSVDVDVTQADGNAAPSGTKTTLLWGAITLHDY